MSFFLGLYVIEKKPHASLNRLFFLIALLTAFLSFAEFGYRISASAETALFWHKLTITWTFTAAISLHLILDFTELTKKPLSWISYLSIYLPALILSFAEYYSITVIDVLVLEYWGWERHAPELTPFIFRNLIWLFIILTIELSILINYFQKTRSKRIKKQTKYIIIGILTPLVILLVNGIVLPKFGIIVPNLTSLSLPVSIIFLGYAIIKHRLFSLTPERIAQDIIKKMTTGFFLVDANKKIVLINEAASALFFQDENQLIGKSLDNIMSDAKKQPHFRTNLLELLDETDNIQNTETEIRTESGKIIPVAVSVFAQREIDGSILGYVIMVNDISKMKKTEKDLVTIEEKYRTVLESVMEGYFEVDLSGRFVFINDAYAQITGYDNDELIGKSYKDLTSEKTAKRLFKIFNKVYRIGIPQKGIRFKMIKKSKETIILETSASLVKDKDGNPIGFSGLTRDATNKVQIEELLIQSEKMLTLGGLSAGIAHEINNPLSAIINTAQLIERKLLIDNAKNEKNANSYGFTMEMLNNYLELNSIPKKVGMIRTAGHRIEEIVKNILSFSRKGNSVFRKHNIPDLLDKTVSLVASEYDLKKKYSFHDIVIVRQYDEDLPLIPCEGSKLQQVFFNLLKNGAQAMSENDSLKKQRIFYLRIKNRDSFVQIEIEDTGKGINKEMSEQIFKPFFTTKKTGTGLGLSISNYIITNNHHGTMNVQSQLGQGTKFVIRLPCKLE